MLSGASSLEGSQHLDRDTCIKYVSDVARRSRRLRLLTSSPIYIYIYLLVDNRLGRYHAGLASDEYLIS